MPGNVVRRSGEGVGLIPSLGRVPRRVVRELDRAGHHALIAGARIEAAAYVTHQAMQHVAALSAEEGNLIQQCPLAEPRLKAIVDTFAGSAAARVAEVGWR